MTYKVGKVTVEDRRDDGQKNPVCGSAAKLAAFAKAYHPTEYREKIAGTKDGEIIKHFSHLRENLISWLPFQGHEHVLEIGGECGALTGSLLKRAGSVTVMEARGEWCDINVERHSDCEQLTILTGELHQLLSQSQEKYDYIFLTGDQACHYLKTDTETVSFIQLLEEHLTGNGSIVIAMPNRLGMKYWAGCAEENYGIPFEGLEGYQHSEGIKTYSWKEWQEIFNSAGDYHVEAYFPEPDIYFPMTIYSEERQPVPGELRQNSFNFEHVRLQLFEDSAVFDSVIRNGMYKEFADAFLFILRKKKVEQREALLYSKYSNDRDLRFSIRTDIVRLEDGIRFVKKIPMSEEAGEHILRLKTIEDLLEKQYAPHGIRPNRCQIRMGEAYFEFLKGQTLEEELDRYLSDKQYDRLEERLFEYLETVQAIHSSKEFFVTDEYRQVFGENIPEAGARCGEVSNIDLIVGNVIFGMECNWIIDYEWTFDFPVPEKYLRYRILHYYLESDSKRNVLKSRNLYKKAGISEEETLLFEKMEESFQKYMKGTQISLSQLYREVNPGVLSVQSILANKIQELMEQKLQVFFDDGEGFREEYSEKFRISEDGFRQKITIPEKVQAVRLDPGEKTCALRIRTLSRNGKKTGQYITNGYECGEGLWYFPEGDPQIILKSPKGKEETLEIAAVFENTDKVSAKMMKEFMKLKQEVGEMKSTKVWKLYEKVKHRS